MTATLREYVELIFRAGIARGFEMVASGEIKPIDDNQKLFINSCIYAIIAEIEAMMDKSADSLGLVEVIETQKWIQFKKENLK